MKKYHRLLLLGDSITYGYGLAGGPESPFHYGNLLGEYLGISKENTVNRAVNGDTSANLLALLPSLEGEIKKADIIVISIGGNDLLGLIRECVDSAENGRFKGTYRLSDIAADPALIFGIAKENKPERLSSVMERYISNIDGVMRWISTVNKDADVMLIMQYDPFEGISVFEPLWKLSENNIGALNRSIAEETKKYGYFFADAYTPFLGHTSELTLMDIFDVHPNENGHRAIFEAVLKTLENM